MLCSGIAGRTPFRSAWARFWHHDSFADTSVAADTAPPRHPTDTPCASTRAPFRAFATLDPVRDLCGIFGV
jgi:hypothetical protein